MKTEIKTMTSKEQNVKITQFLAAFEDGRQAWKLAGEILVELVEADPHVYDYIEQECPSMTPSLLGKFESIGRGLILPGLAMDNSPGSKKLSKLPISMQERFLTEPVPVVTQTETGWDALLVRTSELTPNQAKQVFRNGRYSTVGEQRAWIEDFKLKASAAKPIKSAEKWRLTKKSLIVGGIEFSAAQLAGFVAQLTK
jgi:hypothetical protein